MEHARAAGRSRKLLCAGWCLAACLAVPCAGAAPPAAVPSDLQAAIFGRVLAYDRALKSRVGKTVTIGIVFRPSDDLSKRTRQSMLRSFTDLDLNVQGLPVRVVSHGYEDARHFAAWVGESDVDVLYVAPGLDSAIRDIGALAAEKKLATLTPVREYVEHVEHGLAVAVVPLGDRPQLVVNLSASRAAGIDLDPKALQLSEIVK
jgi:hypothetical protein